MRVQILPPRARREKMFLAAEQKLRPPGYLSSVQSLGKLSLLSPELADDLARTRARCQRKAEGLSPGVVGSYLSGQVLEVVRVADAAQFAVRLSVRVEALHNELGHLSGTRTRGAR